TWGILNVREEFATKNPDTVKRVPKAYEAARTWSLANPDAVKGYLVAVTKLPETVIAKQLGERTELTHSAIGDAQRETILAAGLALQQAGVIKPDVDIKKTVADLIDGSYLAATK
ncbi:MAG: aliphatic sulfonates ABC transporter substrate-binding protein, partial [Hyphomicrobiaceae bacterium]|nr:aliphatic sulfonates ABC transporter substrate-binding protein [Hyphomicrobiaceae bacterium]